MRFPRPRASAFEPCFIGMPPCRSKLVDRAAAGKLAESRAFSERTPPPPCKLDYSVLQTQKLDLNRSSFQSNRATLKIIKGTDHGKANDQWQSVRRRCRAGYAAAMGNQGKYRPDRHQIRLRHCTVRGLYRPRRWRRDALMRRAGQRSCRQADYHHRRTGCRERRPAQGAGGLDRQRRSAMRLLPERHDHGGGGAPQGKAQADPPGTSTKQPPISAAAAPSSRCARRSTPPRTSEEAAMNHMPTLNR